jgi:hypothetical protein
MSNLSDVITLVKIMAQVLIKRFLRNKFIRIFTVEVEI